MKLTDDTPLAAAQQQEEDTAPAGDAQGGAAADGPPADAAEQQADAVPAVAVGDDAAAAAAQDSVALMSPTTPPRPAADEASPQGVDGSASPPRNAAPSPTLLKSEGSKPAAAAVHGAAAPPEEVAAAAAKPQRARMRAPSDPAQATVRDDVTFFVDRAFKKLTTLLPKKQAALKESLEAVCASVGKNGSGSPQAIKLPSSPQALHPLQAYTLLLRNVCETNDPKAVHTALDCMQKIMSFGDISDERLGALPLLTFAKRAHMPIPEPAAGQEHPWKGQRVGLLTEMVAAICSCSTATSPSTQLQAVKALHTAVEKSTHGYALRLAVQTLFSVAVKTADLVTATTAKTALTQVVDRVFKKPAKGEDAELYEGGPMSIAEHDAYCVMSVLCAEALGVDITDSTPQEAPEMKVLTLALEMVEKTLVESCGDLRRSTTFLDAIRTDLLSAVVRHIMSPSPAVLKSSLAIFVCLTTGMFHYFKHEVGFVFTQILMKVLASPHSSYDQQLLVTNAIHKIAQDPQTVMDLFVNFDCDLNEDLVMEEVMGGLSRFIMSSQKAVDWITPKQDALVKGYALQAVVSVLRSMEKWIARGASGDADASNGGGHPVADFAATERARVTKIDVDAVSTLFAEKPKKGINMLVARGLAEMTPASVAGALEKYRRLDRLGVGEFIGDDNNPEYLKAFCALDNYTGMTLDAAIRIFTARFSLPKEGQKIERILEAFAASYFHQNRDAGDCKTEEAVFVLTVGIVMLNTDLHNPKITNKMTPEKFKKQFMGVNGDGDFDDAYLQTLYDNVRDDPMKDKLAAANTDVKEREEGGGLFAAAFTSRRDRKIAAYALEGQRIIESAQATIDALKSKIRGAQYVRAVHHEHVKPMFAACWTALLACFSRYFESDDPSSDVVKLCLEGMAKSIHICSAFDLRTEREAFLRGLCFMTNTTDKQRSIQERNILAIKALLRVPYTDGDTLSSSWLALLRTVAEIEDLRLTGLAQKQKPPTASDFSHNAREVMVHIDEDAMNKIIARSTHVSQVGLKEFVCHLCTVALEEVKRPTGARTFLLSRVVEVASENMGPRILPIWRDISQLLVAVGTHAVSDVACHGVDNLRQLVLKSLGKAELQQCQIQPELLSPFYGIMESSLPSKVVRGLVLECLTQLVVAKLECLGAGLPVLLRALVVGISRHKDKAALDVTVGVVSSLLHPDCLPHVSPHFTEIIHALTYVASDASLNKPLSLKACTTLFSIPERVSTYLPEAGGEETISRLWSDVLEAFTALSLSPDADVRQRSIKELGAALNLSTDPLPVPGQVSSEARKSGPKKVTFSDPIEEEAPPPIAPGEATTGLYNLPTSPTPVTTTRRKRVIGHTVWTEWCHGLLASAIVQPLGKTDAQLTHLRDASAYAYLRYHEIDGHVERVSAKEWHRSTLPGLVEALLVGVVQNNMEHAEFRQYLDRAFPMLLAVLRRLSRQPVMREVHLAGDCLMKLFAATGGQLSSASWSNASLQLAAIFEDCVLLPDVIADKLSTAVDAAADDTDTTLLAYDSLVATYPFPPKDAGPLMRGSGVDAGDDASPAPASAVRMVNGQPARKGSTSTTHVNAYFSTQADAVAILVSSEPSGSSEDSLAHEVGLRCARQASMVALLETLFLKSDVDWCSTSCAITNDDFLRLYRCVKLCNAFFNVFFCAGLREWRAELASDLVDQVRKRRCKALRLNLAFIFRAYNAEREQLREVARADVLTDSLSLIECYQMQHEQLERGTLEPSLVQVIERLLAMDGDDFAQVEGSFFAPLVKCIPCNSSVAVRSLIADFLLRTRS